MSLMKGLLKVTHDVLAEHIAEGVKQYIKVHVDEILPNKLKELGELYGVSKNKEDIIVKNSNIGHFVKNYHTDKDLSYNMNVKNYNYHIECKNIDNKIIVDGVSYKMVPIEVQNKDGQMYKMLAYVEEMKQKEKDDEQHLKLIINEK